MTCRKVILRQGYYYHIFTKSIAGYEIFRSEQEYQRMVETLRFYLVRESGARLSWFLRAKPRERPGPKRGDPQVGILAYCLMPTHLHLFLVQKASVGISDYMMFVLNSYAHYFNKKTKRKGPLWESRFKAVRVEEDAQALHLTRYIHLNPTSAGLVSRPEEWKFSSYREYLHTSDSEPLCEARSFLRLQPDSYRVFVQDRAGFQRTLSIIKKLTLEEPITRPGFVQRVEKSSGVGLTG